MSDSPLNTYAGPIAVIAGGLYRPAHSVMFAAMDRSDLVAMVENPAFQIFSIAYFLTFPLLVIALVALYWRQSSQAGRFGAAAFCVAIIGTIALAGDMWFEGFATPWLVPLAPRCSTAARRRPAPGGLLRQRGACSPLGWILFGLASLRGRIFRRTLSVAVAVGGLIGFLAAMPPWGAGARAGRRRDRSLADPARPKLSGET